MMMDNQSITHIFFDLHGTLVDVGLAVPCIRAYLGDALSTRYGKAPEDWARANQQVIADWDSYFTDLDLDADDGLDQMWEGFYRATRALFRIVGVAEPEQSALWALTRELEIEPSGACDTLYPEAHPLIAALTAAGYTLGVTSHAIQPRIDATLRGANVADQFTGGRIGADVVGHFRKDEAFFMYAVAASGQPAERCLAVDDSAAAIHAAHAIGMQTAYIARNGQPAIDAANWTLPNLAALRSLLVDGDERAIDHPPN